MKLWAGRFAREIDPRTDDFNSSLSFDCRMHEEDIAGSLAHSRMLFECGIIDEKTYEDIRANLQNILSDLKSGALTFESGGEDIHTFVEAELTARAGDAGKRLHTARSRNDQVALDLRLWLLKTLREIRAGVLDLVEVLRAKAESHADTVMPGYTHLQRAQPVTFGHHLTAYAEMLLRDEERLRQCAERTAVSPLGAGALAGTTYPIDRERTAALLHLLGAARNSLDAVSDRDFAAEFLADASILMVHLSRFCEEIILWCSWEYKFVELDDAFSTGSSIMPQKKNPDIAELVRGKTGRVFGDLMGLLTVLKGLPLAYNKDMQEDKEAVFDAADTVLSCLRALTPMVETMKVRAENMRKAASEGFLNATDCADYLTKKGMPFRDAYRVTGALVARCIEENRTFETLPLTVYREYSALFEEDVYDAVNLDRCVRKRTSLGGPSPECVRRECERLIDVLGGRKTALREENWGEFEP